MPHNAHVTTEPGHVLGPGSTAVVCDGRGVQVATAPVPMTAGDSTDFWARVNTALATIGWATVHEWPGEDDPAFSDAEPGIVRFTAVQKES